MSKVFLRYLTEMIRIRCTKHISKEYNTLIVAKVVSYIGVEHITNVYD